MIGVIAFVGDRGACSEAIDKLMCEGNVVALPRRPNQAERIAERITRGVDLGAQPISRPAQALGIRPPFKKMSETFSTLVDRSLIQKVRLMLVAVLIVANMPISARSDEDHGSYSPTLGYDTACLEVLHAFEEHIVADNKSLPDRVRLCNADQAAETEAENASFCLLRLNTETRKDPQTIPAALKATRANGVRVLKTAWVGAPGLEPGTR